MAPDPVPGRPREPLTHPGGHLPQARAAAAYDRQVTLQFFEQHSELDPQNDPTDLQGWHWLLRQLPEQQTSGDAQLKPVFTQQPLTSLHLPL
jgi:hypothetical protein